MNRARGILLEARSGLLLRLLLLALFSSTNARRLDDIYWNSTNPIFDISNTDHVKAVEIGDQVSIICPLPGSDYEYSMLYLVSEEEYNHCVLMGDARQLGACVDSQRNSSLSVVFRSVSPIPGGIEFRPGRTYYLISTSDGSEEGVEVRKGGLCESHQMKVKFEVEIGSQKKSGRHDERSFNPKFAARTVERSESDTSTQQLMYIIHDDAEGGNPDDDSASEGRWLPALLLVLAIQRLLIA